MASTPRAATIDRATLNESRLKSICARCRALCAVALLKQSMSAAVLALHCCSSHPQISAARFVRNARQNRRADCAPEGRSDRRARLMRYDYCVEFALPPPAQSLSSVSNAPKSSGTPTRNGRQRTCGERSRARARGPGGAR